MATGEKLTAYETRKLLISHPGTVAQGAYYEQYFYRFNPVALLFESTAVAAGKTFKDVDPKKWHGGWAPEKDCVIVQMGQPYSEARVLDAHYHEEVRAAKSEAFNLLQRNKELASALRDIEATVLRTRGNKSDV